MVMVAPFPYVFQQEMDDDGNPLAGGKIYSYIAGTDTLKDTYTSYTGGTANANPVVLDAAGRPDDVDIWLGPGNYKFVITDADDNIIRTRDHIPGATNQALGAVVESISSNETLVLADKNTHFDCTAALTISLLAAASAGEGYIFSVRNSSSGAVTLDPDGAELINNAATVVLSPGESALVLCDGSGYFALFIQQPSQTLAKSANYTVVIGDQGKMLLVDATSGAVTITLPPAASTVNGYELTVKKIDSSTNSVTIDANAVETIDGVETYVLYRQYESLSIKTNNTTWYINQPRPLVPITSAKTANYTVTLADDGKTFLCDATSASFTITLPVVASTPNGFRVTVKKTDSSANTVTIDGDSSETIDDAATWVLKRQYEAVTIVNSQVSWQSVSKKTEDGLIDVQSFTSSGTWNMPAGTRKLIVFCTGGGASGGGETASSSDGNDGGNSSFGSHCSATGGSKGVGGAAGAGGAGGTGANGLFNLKGGSGFIQGSYNGGTSFWGGGGGKGAAGGNYGAGGGGGGASTTTGGGGGAGGTSVDFIASGIGSTETVTIGAGGAAVAVSGGTTGAGAGGIIVVMSFT